MAKFMVIYRAPKGAWDSKKDVTPEDMKKGMEEWMKWADDCGDKLADMGSPLGKVTIINSEGAKESSDEIAGYSLLEAENLEDAKALLLDHPHLKWAEGCEISLYECKKMPSME